MLHLYADACLSEHVLDKCAFMFESALTEHEA